MPYEIVYDAESGRILAARPTAAPREDLVLGEGQSKLFLQFDFAGRPLSAFRVDLEAKTLALRDDWVEPEQDVVLELGTDAAAVSPIDGIPEIPADGKTAVKIMVQKVSTKSGQRLTGARHNNQLNIRATAGALSARQVNLNKGQASFSLHSSTETVVAEVRVWAAEGEIPQPAILRIEFAPVT
jgi:hypothetical protein